MTCRRSLRSLLRAGEAVPQLPHSIVLAGGNEGGGEPGKYEEKGGKREMRDGAEDEGGEGRVSWLGSGALHHPFPL